MKHVVAIGLTVALAAFAGCAGAPTAPAEPTPTHPSQSIFGEAITLMPESGREPSLAFDAEGYGYYSTLPSGLASGYFGFFRSEPGTTTWESIDTSHPIDTLSSGDTDLVTTKDAVYVVDLDGLLASGYALGKSTDHGATWTWTKPHGLIPPLDRPWLVEDGDDVVGIAYNAVHGLYYLISLDDGLSFPIHIPVHLLDEQTRHAFPGKPDMNERTGTIAIPYYLDDLADTLTAGGPDLLEEVGVALSDDGGLTWRHVTTPRPDAFKAGIWSVQDAVWTPDDRLVVAFYEMSAGPDGRAGRAFVVRLTEDLTAFEEPVELTTGHTGVMPWAAVAPDGTLGVAYYAADEGVKMPWDIEGNWTVRAAFVDMDTGTVEHHDVSPETVRRGPLCGGAGACRSGTDDPNTRILLDFLNTAWTPDGRFAVAYGAEMEPGAEDTGVFSRFAITQGPVTL